MLSANTNLSDALEIDEEITSRLIVNIAHEAAVHPWLEAERQRHKVDKVLIEPCEPLPRLKTVGRNVSEPLPVEKTLSHTKGGRRTNELFYRPGPPTSTQSGSEHELLKTVARRMSLTRGRRMRALFYRPPTRTHYDNEQQWLKTVGTNVSDEPLPLERTLGHTKGGSRTSELFYRPPTSTQRGSEHALPKPVARRISLPLPDSRLLDPSNPPQRKWWDHFEHLEHKALLQRLERLNFLSSVIDGKILQALQK